ncbi:hypothetical protein BJ742DRAFT_292234 [Cladochytrium replicatum]|nr:hypothetical protein BJ742DRAFT_292234 [Cladochytrium replicatum]
MGSSSSKPAFANKRVVVLGASRGIGRDLSLLLAKQGARLLLCARNANNLKVLAEECVAAGAVECHTFAGDLTNRADINKIDATIRGTLGDTIDAVFMNFIVGILPTLAVTTTDESIDMWIDGNVKSAILLTRAILPLLHGAPAPQLIYHSTIAVYLPLPSLSLYRATKAAMNAYMDSLQTEAIMLHALETDKDPSNLPLLVTQIDIGPTDTDALQEASGNVIFDSGPVATASPALTAEFCIKAATQRKRKVSGPQNGFYVARIIGQLIPGLATKMAAASATILPVLFREAQAKLKGPVSE